MVAVVSKVVDEKDGECVAGDELSREPFPGQAGASQRPTFSLN